MKTILPVPSSRSSRVPNDNSLETNTPPILLIPVEILFLVGNFLRPIDLLCLSLSCKTTFAIFHPSKAKYASLTADEKYAFLERLEQDLGSHYTFCSRCTMLHSFSRDLASYWHQEYLGPRCLVGEFLPMCQWTRGRACLDYEMARLFAINNRHGPSKGMDLQHFLKVQLKLSQDKGLKSLTRGLSPIKWHVTIDMKFDHSQLLLRATHRLPRSSLKQAMRLDEISQHLLCEHTYVLPEIPPRAFNNITAVQVSDDGVAEIAAIMNCPQCPTEWTINLDHTGKDNLDIQVETHHLFGNISSHDHFVWLLMTDNSAEDDHWRLRRIREDFISVKDIWEST